MPADDSVGLNNDEELSPGRPCLGEENPEESVPAIEARSPPFSLKHSQLMSKREYLGGDVISRSDEGEGRREEASDDGEHG